MPSDVGFFTDRFGNSFYFGNTGSYRIPPYPIGKNTVYSKHVKAIRDMEIYDDDILLCSFPKSGLHWHAEIISRLRNKTDQMLGNVSPHLESKPYEGPQDAERPRLISTHAHFHLFPRQALEKKIKIIHLIRNPKDVLVSYYHMFHGMKKPFAFTGTFEQFVRLYLECGHYHGDPFEHMLSYQDGFELHPDVPVFTSVFEDMKRDPIGGVMKLNEFLGTGCDPELCERIAHACSIKKVTSGKEKAKDEVFMLERTLFAQNNNGFYRKGEIGDWKNWFTESFNEEFDKEMEKRMNGYKIKFTYE